MRNVTSGLKLVPAARVEAAPPRSVTILGATGSVGRSTIDLIEHQRDSFEVVALTAGKDAPGLAAAARRLGAKRAVVADERQYAALKGALAGSGIEAAAGAKAVVEAAEMPADWVMAAIVGSAGLASTLAAVRRGAMVAFANKECLVCAGPLMMAEIARHGARLLPVDSEHNAIFQVFDGNRDAIHRIILTASGGPFRGLSRAEMAAMGPAQAVAHPNWSMGAKISVDSATMMNKGLEVIEAAFLFDMPSERIDVLVHPQSVVHSLVEYVDGSMLAQLGAPDMRTPIAHALAWPKRMHSSGARLDLLQASTLTFEAADPERFPALALARAALQRGETAPTILNAANEVAVQAFLDGRIGFLDIAATVADTLSRVATIPLADLDTLYAVDAEARDAAAALVTARAATRN